MPINPRIIFFCVSLYLSHLLFAQNESEVGKTLEQYIEENHIENIENMVHQFADSKLFLDFLLQEGHNIDLSKVQLKRKDVSIGADVDVYVKHFTEHQNFTMILVPISIYPLAIYDTLLFSILEVSDEWMKEKYRYHVLDNDSVLFGLMSIENHKILSDHIFQQALQNKKIKMTEISIKLNEAYISSGHLEMHIAELSKEEKKQFRNHWSFMKKAFTHSVELDVEMNIYLFGNDDMQVIYNSQKERGVVQITPNNIFPRHNFESK
jgi:hypothetical protein